MALESLLQQSAVGNEIYEEESSAKKCKKSVSTNVTGSDCTPSSGFDCNICLDFVQDPVVTLCGHLYCWPCIYKWLTSYSATTVYSDQPEPQCPVCKSLITESTLVPLYGRGKTVTTSEQKTSNLDLVIPPRPPAPVSGHMIPSSQSQNSAQPVHHANLPQLHHRNILNQPHPYYLRSSHSPSLGFGGFSTQGSSVHPVVGMFSEMVYERMFGNPMTNIYNYQNPYMNNSPRLRRQAMQADKSLSRICFFLFCCIFLCLLLF
ncbi:unnamed protein product [Rhodiola kirilowii]